MNTTSTAAPARPALARELALLLLLSTLWGASYTLIKITVATIPPITAMGARTALAGLVLLLVMKALRQKLPLRADAWRAYLVLGLLNSIVPFTLVAWAHQTIDAGLAVILNATTPIFTVLLTAAFTRHESVPPRKLAGVAVGILGIATIVGVEALGGIGRDLAAQLAMILATLCYAGSAIYGTRFSGTSPLAPAAGSLLCAGAVLIPLALLVEAPWRLTPSAESIAALVALAIFSTAAAFALFYRLVRTLGSVGTTAQAYLRVPIGIAIGAVALGERLPPEAWLGLAAVLTGVFLMTLPARGRTP